MSLVPTNRLLFTLSLVVVISLSEETLSAPVVGVEPPYVPEPSGRGTVSLLSTCIITLTLCVWTALHLNIDTSRQRWRRTAKKAGWACLALLAPEVVLWRAWSQLLVSRELRTQMNHQIRIEAREEEGCRRTTWSLRFAFFAVMGGFQVSLEDTSIDDERWTADLQPDGSTLTPCGVLFLSKNKIWRDFHVRSIKDKSKSDSLAKTLVCIQAGWMIIQILARKAVNLPVTLIEVNTLAHVIAAVFIYAIWWYKPQNVNEPERVNIAGYLVAVMSPSFLRLRSHFIVEDDDITYPEFQYPEPLPTTFLSQLQLFDQSSGDWAAARPMNETDQTVVGMPWSIHYRNTVPGEAEYDTIEERRGNRSVKIQVSRRILSWGDEKDKRRRIKRAIKAEGKLMLLPGERLQGSKFVCGSGPIHLTSTEIRMLGFMSSQLRYPKLRPYLLNTSKWEMVRQCFAPSAPDLLIPGGLETSIHRGFFILAILSFLYGGLHLLSWNSHFPSDIEQTLWRISTSIIAGGGFGVWLVVFLSSAETNPFYFVIYHLFWLCPIAYGLARLFIVIEAFISVRSLPEGAYQTVSWSVFPHIG